MSLHLVIPKSKYETLDDSVKKLYSQNNEGVYELLIVAETATEHSVVNNIISPLNAKIDLAKSSMDDLQNKHNEASAQLKALKLDSKKAQIDASTEKLINSLNVNDKKKQLIQRILDPEIAKANEDENFDLDTFNAALKGSIDELSKIDPSFLEPQEKQQSIQVTKTPPQKNDVPDEEIALKNHEKYITMKPEEINYDEYLEDYFEK